MSKYPLGKSLRNPLLSHLNFFLHYPLSRPIKKKNRRLIIDHCCVYNLCFIMSLIKYREIKSRFQYTSRLLFKVGPSDITVNSWWIPPPLRLPPRLGSSRCQWSHMEEPYGRTRIFNLFSLKRGEIPCLLGTESRTSDS